MSVVDFAIIGGGIAGLSAAAELSALGSVLLVEAESALGYHASGRSAAMFLPCFGNATVRAMNDASAEAHRAAGVLSPRRFLVVAPHPKADAFAAMADDLGLERIGAEDAHGMLPILRRDWLAHAATLPAWDLDTDRLLQACRRTALDHGARIVTGARVTSIARDGGRWRLNWAGGTAHATHIVNAAGAWADGVAAMADVAPLGLIPHRRSMAQLAAPADHDVTDWPFVEEVGDAWYAKPDAGRWLVSPAEEDPADPGDAWADDMVLAEGLARYQDAVVPEVTRPLHTWAGLRTFARDRTLVIGPDPATRGFWWLAGQGGYGFQTAPAAARHLAERIEGQTPTLGTRASDALDPARLTAAAQR